jgi:hypothetical protein
MVSLDTNQQMATAILFVSCFAACYLCSAGVLVAPFIALREKASSWASSNRKGCNKGRHLVVHLTPHCCPLCSRRPTCNGLLSDKLLTARVSAFL